MSLLERILRRSPRPIEVPATAPYHGVQVYDEDEVLQVRLETFVLDGARQGKTTVVIATAKHRQMLRERLAVWDLEDSFLGLDAQLTLDRFMRGGMPDPHLFDTVVGQLVRSQAANGLQAFGEMVSLLWREGNVEGTLALERLWGLLQETVPFSLLCGYASSDFTDRPGLAKVCELHTHVEPNAA
jgi:hypothetical protein